MIRLWRFAIALWLVATADSRADQPFDYDDELESIPVVAVPNPTGPLRFIEELTWSLQPALANRTQWNLFARTDELFNDEPTFNESLNVEKTGAILAPHYYTLRATGDGEARESAAELALRLKRDGLQHVASSKTALDRLALSSSLTLREHDDPLDPAFRGAWETFETLKMPVAGPLFAFAQLDASSTTVELQQYKWLGKYGVGVKLKPWLAPEVQVRGGPAVRYDDTGKPLRGTSAERSELFMEAVTKVGLPLVGSLNVEYTSYAVPAATASERGMINQDLRLARPLFGGGELHVGAKYRWEDAATSATPWVDRMQVYMGVQLKR